MASLEVLIPSGPNSAAAKKVTLLGDSGASVTLPITDPKVDLGNLAPNWVQVPRPGLQEPAYMSRGPRKLHVLKLSVTLVDLTGQGDLEQILADLYKVLFSTEITLGYGGFESSPDMTATGKYVCTSFEPQVTKRDPESNNATQGTGTIELTESNPVPNLVIGNALSNQAGLALAASIFKALHPSPPATYTVKTGDTLMSVSFAVYGTTSQWRLIGDYNFFGPTEPLLAGDPRLLKAGSVLKIPPLAGASGT